MSSVMERVKNKIEAADRHLRQVFSIDLRALAAFRICLGVLILWDLVVRSQDIVVFYTEKGVLPQSVLTESFSTYHLSAYTWVSGTWWVWLLFGIAAVAAVFMIAGLFTRTATIISWYLLLSLHTRNILVLNSGDVLFHMTLFWGMFLPLGRRWSLDEHRLSRSTQKTRFAGIGSVGVMVQVVLMYFFAGLYKLRGDTWVSGDALYYALHLEMFTTPIGDWLRAQSMIVTVLTYSILVLWLSSPFLLLAYDRFRSVHAGLFIGAHLGMAAAMTLGLFPAVAITCLLVFVGTSTWDSVDRYWKKLPYTGSGRIMSAVSELPRLSINADSFRAGGRVVLGLVGVAVLVFIVLFNTADYGNTGAEQPVGFTTQPLWGEAVDIASNLGFTQYWGMFSPDPLRQDGWVVVEGWWQDNSSAVDIYNRKRLSYEKPADISTTYRNQRWRKYLSNLWTSDAFKSQRDELLAWYCRTGDRFERVRFVVVTQGANMSGDLSPHVNLLETRTCKG